MSRGCNPRQSVASNPMCPAADAVTCSQANRLPEAAGAYKRTLHDYILKFALNGRLPRFVLVRFLLTVAALPLALALRGNVSHAVDI